MKLAGRSWQGVGKESGNADEMETERERELREEEKDKRERKPFHLLKR